MPNWCNNNIELSHPDKAMVERAKAAFVDGRLLEEFIPMPAELKDTEAPSRVNNEHLVAKYGASDWYDWCIQNWGTKWDISPYDCEVDGNNLTGSFDSPWGPPIEAYKKLEDLGFEVRAYFNEPGMGFCGMYEGMEESYDYSGMSADEAEDMLPETLNEMYGITESMREWEDENGENDE